MTEAVAELNPLIDLGQVVLAVELSPFLLRRHHQLECHGQPGFAAEASFGAFRAVPARAAVFRGRERLVHQRTADVNALRALLLEHGHVLPAGIRYFGRMTALVQDDASDLPALIREECQDLLAQIAEKTARIAGRNKKLSALASQSDKARRLQTMPGGGPLTAGAVEAFGPDMAQFKTGRAFVAWLGLVPRQHSSGGKERLGL